MRVNAGSRTGGAIGRRRRALGAGGLIGALLGMGLTPHALAQPSNAYVPGQIVVKVAPNGRLSAIDARYGTRPIAGLGDGATYLLALPVGGGVDDTQHRMAADQGVAYAAPNLLVTPPEAQPSTLPFFDSSGSPGPFHDQYALAQIHAQPAWHISTGAGVTVAVLDTGVDLSHPQLAGRLVTGYNVLDGTANPGDTAAHVDTNGDGVVDEALGHGTHVAGIIALAAPGSAIMPVKVLDSDGVGTTFGVALGIHFAIDHGARVLNMSLGVPGRDPTIADALNYASLHDANVVASAGNSDLLNAIQSPASEQSAIGVAAIDRGDHKAPFSNYGAWVKVCAPGVDIYSLFHDGGYATWSGTSMAAPFVSAEAALLRAVHPHWTAGQLAGRIRSTADSIDAANPAYVGELGSGRIDVFSALQSQGV